MKKFLEKAIEQTNQSVLIFTNSIKNRLVNPEIVYANDKFLENCGLSFEDIEHKSPEILLRKNPCNDYMKKLVATITSNKVWSGIIELEPNGTDTPIPFYVEIIPVCNSENKAKYYACYGDVVNEHDYEIPKKQGCEHVSNFVDSLLEKTDVFKNFANELPLGIWRTDVFGNFTYLNSETKEHFGISKNDNIFELMGEKLSGEVIKKITFLHNSQWIKTTIWTIKEEGIIEGYCGVFNDVSDQYNLMLELKKINQEM